MDRNIFCIHAQLFKTVKCGSIFLKLNVFIYAALCKKDQMSSAYKRTKSHLNTAPPQLNLFRYVTKKASTLWKEAKEKCILKDEGEPIEIFHLICEQDDSNVETCLKRFGFDDYQLDKMC